MKKIRKVLFFCLAVALCASCLAFPALATKQVSGRQDGAVLIGEVACFSNRGVGSVSASGRTPYYMSAACTVYYYVNGSLQSYQSYNNGYNTTYVPTTAYPNATSYTMQRAYGDFWANVLAGGTPWMGTVTEYY